MRFIYLNDFGRNGINIGKSGLVEARNKCIASAAIAAASVLLAGRGVSAATDAWQGPTTDSNWNTTANWTPAVPGTIGTFTSADVALFNSGSGVVNVDANRNVKSINFDLTGGAFNLSGGNFLLTSGGAIQILSTFTSTSTTETISSPITLEGSYSFINSGAASDLLNFSGNISNGAAATLTLAASNAGGNSISAVISNGEGATSLSDSSGNWILSAANTFTGGTAIGGTLTNYLEVANSLALQNSIVTLSHVNGLAFQSGLGSATIAGLSGGSNEPLTDLTTTAAVNLNIGNFYNATTSAYTRHTER